MVSLPKTYKAALIPEPGKPFSIQDRPLRLPQRGEVLVRVLACGVCGTDDLSVEGLLGSTYPIAPGHELVGDVVAVGEGESRVKEGDRVGGPFHGGHCGTCRSCERGLFQYCENRKANGVTFDGGYAEYVILRSEAVVRIPKDMDPAEVAPLLCAGVTVFGGIRKMHIEQGNLVVVQGLGGLGHLAVQFANKMGYEVVALSQGGAKRELAAQLGAHHYIDMSAEDPVKALQALGGAALVVITAPNPAAVGQLALAMQPEGKILILPLIGDVSVNTMTMVIKGISVLGYSCGHAVDSEETIEFARRHGIKAVIERFPFSDAQKAYDAMMANRVRFRAVLTM